MKLSRCEYDNTPVDEDQDCPICIARNAAAKAYYGALYRAEQRYTREEVEECYSEPCEANKRDIVIERLGL